MIKRILLIVFLCLLIALSKRELSYDHQYRPELALMPHIDIDDDLVHIDYVRNSTYKPPQLQYMNKTYNMSQLESLWFFLQPFNDYAGHTLLSFGFSDGTFLAYSVEARKEVAEEWSPLYATFNTFELMYVFGSERDLITVRTYERNSTLLMYELNISTSSLQALFLDVVQHAQQLQTQPEFYNTFTSTCTTNLVKHARRINPHAIPRTKATLLPGYSDDVLYDLGLIITNASQDELTSVHNITRVANQYINDPQFSQMIRKEKGWG
jgi:hypothetical protein